MADRATSSAHTPGPWHYSWLDDAHGWILDRKHNYLAEIVTHDEESLYVSAEQQQANAYLIAAAPELLEHLSRMVQMARSVCANWESNRLASAVQNLDRTVIAAEAVMGRIRPRFIGDYQSGMVTPTNLTVLANCRRMKDAVAIAKKKGGRVVPYLYGHYKRGWVVTTLPNASA